MGETRQRSRIWMQRGGGEMSDEIVVELAALLQVSQPSPCERSSLAYESGQKVCFELEVKDIKFQGEV